MNFPPRPLFLILLFGLSPVFSQNVKGKEIQGLEEAMRRSQATHGQVVQTIRTQFDIADGQNAPLGVIETLESLSGWKKGRPERKETFRKVTGKPGFFIAFTMGFENHPDRSLIQYEKIKGQTLERSQEGTFVVFEVGDEKDTWTGRIWINSENQSLHRADYWIRRPSFIGVKKLEYSITFLPDPLGNPLPKTCDIRATGSMFFMTRKVQIHQEYLEWTKSEAGN